MNGGVNMSDNERCIGTVALQPFRGKSIDNNVSITSNIAISCGFKFALVTNDRDPESE